MPNNIPAESGATQASVVSGLGYPNGRREVSPEPTGWQASNVLTDGSADLSSADVEMVASPSNTVH